MEFVHDILRFIDTVPAWVTALTGLVTAASAVTALTPTPKDDAALRRVYRVLELLALNIGHSRRH